MTDILWYGFDALITAVIAILGYEIHAWLTREEPTISWLVRRWRGKFLWRRMLILSICFFIGFCIQFLGIHFSYNIG